MKTKRSRLLCVALVLSMLLSCWPAWQAPSAAAEDALGIVTSSSVHVRKEASRYGEIWFDLPQNYVCTILEETTAEGIHWYKVKTGNPESTTGSSTYIGFIHGDYFRALSAQEMETYRQGAVVSNPPSGSGSGKVIGVVTNGGTNFRDGPSLHAESMMKLDRGTEVEILSIPASVSSETFYEVRYGNTTGYIMSTFIRLANAQATPTAPGAPTQPPDNNQTGGQPTPTVPPAQGDQPTPTTPPAQNGNNGQSTGAFTHVRLILSSCHLREAPAGRYDSENDWVGRGSTLPIAGQPVVNGPYTWYPVLKGGYIYYVRNDCVQPYSEAGATVVPDTVVTTPTAVPAPATAVPTILGYVITTKGGVNLRSSIGGTVIKQIKKNVRLPYLLPPVKKDGYTWYYVDADGNRGYVRSDVVKITGTPTPTPAPTLAPNTTATADPATGYVKTTAGGVNLRKKAGYTDVLGQVDRDVVLPYFGDPTTVKGAVWYYVLHPSLGYGYLSGSYLTPVRADGSALPTATPIVTGSGSQNTATASQQEATYNTLKLGSTGSAVKNLVTELKKQGYYNGSITSRYTSSVERAVRAFQEAKKLSVDGIAGAATQHALYNTVPVGAADTSNLTMTIYPAEKINWYTGGIDDLWPRGSNYKVFDVKTGIVWWAHRWAGGKHVDAEPLTAADTARLCKSYGVTTAQEIADKNLYQRRPLLVTIGTRTFACSLYGVPHNYPEGDTIADNEFRGQLCIHFTGSKTHNSNNVDSGHEEAIEYAWENAPNGHI